LFKVHTPVSPLTSYASPLRIAALYNTTPQKANDIDDTDNNNLFKWEFGWSGLHTMQLVVIKSRPGIFF